MKIFNKSKEVVADFSFRGCCKFILKGVAVGVFSATTKFFFGISVSIALFILLMLGLICFNYYVKGKRGRSLYSIVGDALVFTIAFFFVAYLVFA